MIMSGFYLAKDIDTLAIKTEQKFLNSIVIGGKLLPGIGPKDFLKREHRLIIKAMLKLDKNDEPIDLVTVANELNNEGYLESVGGPRYLADLSEMISEGESTDPRFYGWSLLTFALIRERVKENIQIKLVIE